MGIYPPIAGTFCGCPMDLGRIAICIYQLFFCDIDELTFDEIHFFSTGTTCVEDLNWDCKGWKEGPMMCSGNKMLKLFLVMEFVALVCGKGWFDNDGAAP